MEERRSAAGWGRRVSVVALIVFFLFLLAAPELVDAKKKQQHSQHHPDAICTACKYMMRNLAESTVPEMIKMHRANKQQTGVRKVPVPTG